MTWWWKIALLENESGYVKNGEEEEEIVGWVGREVTFIWSEWWVGWASWDDHHLEKMQHSILLVVVVLCVVVWEKQIIL